MDVKVNPINITRNLFDMVSIRISKSEKVFGIITDINLVKKVNVIRPVDVLDLNPNTFEISVIPSYTISALDGNSFPTFNCLDWGEEELDIRSFIKFEQGE